MDFRRVMIMVLLLGGLVWAATSSPLTKRLFGGAPARRAAPPPGALAPLESQPSPVAGAPAEARGGGPVTPLTREELTRWREVNAAAWRRDPFFTAAEEQALLAPRPAATATAKTPPAPPPTYTVKAILISDGFKVATLDGRVVSEGDPIGDERVVEIRPDAVVLERAGQRRRLGLPGGTTTITETPASPRGTR